MKKLFNKKISIIVVVKDDLSVERTVAFLVKHYADDAEIIVVYRFNKMFIPIIKRNPTVLWIPYRPKNKKTITIAEQRNIGIRESKGSLIVFIDCGCIPEHHDWLFKLITPLSNGENITVGSVKSTESQYIIGTPKIHDIDYVNEFITANVAFKKSLLKSVGEFDERLFYSSDTDYSYRAYKADYKARFIPTALIIHTDTNEQISLRRSFWYGFGRGCLFKKYLNDPNFRKFQPNNYKVFFLISLAYFILISLSPLAAIKPKYLLLISLLFLINARNDNPIKNFINKYLFGLGLFVGFVYY